MASNNNWIADTVCDFIHSTIWAAPIHTFIEANCAAFDYDDDDDDDTVEEEDKPKTITESEEEQKKIHQKYQRLADALIDGLRNDLSLDANELRKVCELQTEGNDLRIADEAYEQLYSARDFELFQEMMRRKNLILQLQALVSLQLEWGILRRDDSGEDIVLALLLQATSTKPLSRRTSVDTSQQSINQSVAKLKIDETENKHQQQNENKNDNNDDDDDVVVMPSKEQQWSSRTKERKEPKKPPKEEYQLPNLRHKGGPNLDVDWVRKLQQNTNSRDNNNETIDDDQSKKMATAQAIRSIPEDVLRQKLRDLAAPTSVTDDAAIAAINSRKNFLQEQRKLIVEKQRAERERELVRETQEQEQEQQQQSQSARPARPQSAAHIARKAMGTTSENEKSSTPIPDAELQKRRAMADRLRREVVDKR